MQWGQREADVRNRGLEGFSELEDLGVYKGRGGAVFGGLERVREG